MKQSTMVFLILFLEKLKNSSRTKFCCNTKIILDTLIYMIPIHYHKLFHCAYMITEPVITKWNVVKS